MLKTPNGLDEIVIAFGDIQTYIEKDGTLAPAWQAERLAHAALPFPLPLDWNRAVSVEHVLCHKLLVDTFEEVFNMIAEEGLWSRMLTFGGCFAYRAQRTGTKLSTHAWGIAIDLNPATNAQGTLGSMDAGIIDVFRAAGFKWGGDWVGKTKDPMHFQFATGY